MKLCSAVVSQMVPVGFDDLASAAGALAGQEFAENRTRLEVDRIVGTGLVGAIRFGGTLRTASWLLPSVNVEVVVSPWSTGRSEVAIHPITNLGPLDSRRAHLFYRAARSILPVVIKDLYARLPMESPAALVLAA